MQPDSSENRKLLSKDITDTFVRIGLIAFLVIMCALVFAPFVHLVLWALILAVALYPLHLRLAKRLGGRQGYAATLLVVAGLLLIGAPTIMLGSSLAGHVHDGYTAIENQTVKIPQPDPAVADWPIVGKRLYTAWNAAAEDFPAFLDKNREQVKSLSKRALSATAGTLGAVLMFLGSLIIAGIIMAYGHAGNVALRRVFSRIAGSDSGSRLQVLSTSTIRSVAVGVIGVAFIQALLLGMGFMMAGIPGAGVLALVVMLLGIVQLPAVIVSLPAIAYLWISGDASTTSNIVFSIYLLVAGLADNVLKPLLLGRGVDAPMPIILIGALGGMVVSGIIGLFVGAVVLALGYQIFMDWVHNVEAQEAELAGTESAEQSSPVRE